MLGQFNFTNNTANLVDGFGFDMLLPNRLRRRIQHGEVAIDKSVSPNRLWVADTDNNRVLGWSTVAAFTTHAPADIVIGQSDFISNRCDKSAANNPSSCAQPTGVAVDGAGNLYVADSLTPACSNTTIPLAAAKRGSGRASGLRLRRRVLQRRGLPAPTAVRTPAGWRWTWRTISTSPTRATTGC